jgi:hypothetical protein
MSLDIEANYQEKGSKVKSALERVTQTRRISEIHIFAAVPQSFMMMLGRVFKGMPSVQLYEWDGSISWRLIVFAQIK